MGEQRADYPDTAAEREEAFIILAIRLIDEPDAVLRETIGAGENPRYTRRLLRELGKHAHTAKAMMPIPKDEDIIPAIVNGEIIID